MQSHFTNYIDQQGATPKIFLFLFCYLVTFHKLCWSARRNTNDIFVLFLLLNLWSVTIGCAHFVQNTVLPVLEMPGSWVQQKNWRGPVWGDPHCALSMIPSWTGLWTNKIRTARTLINHWSNTNLSLERYRHEGHQGPLSRSTDSILDKNLYKQNKDSINDTKDCCVFWLFWTGICRNKSRAAWRSSRITASFHQLCSGQESVQIKLEQHESHQGSLHPFIDSVLDRNLYKQNKDSMRTPRTSVSFHQLFWTGICTNTIRTASRTTRTGAIKIDKILLSLYNNNYTLLYNILQAERSVASCFPPWLVWSWASSSLVVHSTDYRVGVKY